MKLPSIFVFGLMATIGLFSVVAFINHKNEVPQKHLELVFRNIGHQLLLRGQDSTSRVLPVKQLDENTYQISFENAFVFVPDTLVQLVQRQLNIEHLPTEYTVSVMDCQHKETIFAYEISAHAGNLIPCSGRTQAKACYLIQVGFLITDHSNLYWLLLLIPFCFAGIYLPGNFRKKHEKENPPDDLQNFVPLGKYRFYPENNSLHLDNQRVSLTKNETKALTIFAENLNQVVEREQLMKAIWEDEGVIVISRNVDVLVSKLRKKLSEDSAIKITNIHGKGYKFLVEKVV